MKSVLVQDFLRVEVPVVDDGSTDGELPWAVRLCHAKRRLGQWVRGRFLRTR